MKTEEKTVKVLVVDDNEDFSENVRDVIESHGCEAKTAYDGFKAIEAVKKDPPDVILMDVKMPGMDGLEAFRKIREIAPQMSVIMMTGFAMEEVIGEAIREGARASLKKPLDFNILMSLIRCKGGEGRKPT